MLDEHSIRSQIADVCLHFTGLQNEKCAAGVYYLDMTEDGAYRLPCFRDKGTDKSGKPQNDCPKLTWRTDQEIDAEIDKLNRAAVAYFEQLKTAVCPYCHHKVDAYRQVEGSVYADPCGHRQYKGSLSLLRNLKAAGE